MLLKYPDVERVKRCALKGMASADALHNVIVLKGGNAIDLVHHRGTRSSIDLDFSIAADFSNLESVIGILEENIAREFRSEMKLRVFDFSMIPKPKELSGDVADFWGGYLVEFKLSTEEMFEQYEADIEALRRNAIPVTLAGQRKFKIEISKYEFCEPKRLYELDGGVFLYAYTEAMIVAEKLRAVCQQMTEYAPIVRRSNRPGAPRARDFFDIYGLVSLGLVNPDSQDFHDLLVKTFNVKRVPLAFLKKVGDYREFHRSDFQRVKDSLKRGDAGEDFDFYFDFVLRICERLKPLWDV